MATQIKKHILHVNGMHCNACVLLIESELQDLPNVNRATPSLSYHSVEIEGDFGDKSLQEIAEELSQVLVKHGYTLSHEKQEKIKMWSDFKIAVPIALAFILLFIFLQKIGLVNLVGGGNVS